MKWIKAICKSNMPYITGPGFMTDKPLSNLTVGKTYRAVLEEEGYIRVWDDFGEDYRYPLRMFEPVKD
jgi:hypothetical protein